MPVLGFEKWTWKNYRIEGRCLRISVFLSLSLSFSMRLSIGVWRWFDGCIDMYIVSIGTYTIGSEKTISVVLGKSQGYIHAHLTSQHVYAQCIWSHDRNTTACLAILPLTGFQNRLS